MRTFEEQKISAKLGKPKPLIISDCESRSVVFHDPWSSKPMFLPTNHLTLRVVSTYVIQHTYLPFMARQVLVVCFELALKLMNLLAGCGCVQTAAATDADR